MDRFAEQPPRSRALHAEMRQRVAGGVGHDLRHGPVTPIYIARALGTRKCDVGGNEFLDFGMGNAALLLGHAHPAVLAAVREALDHGPHIGNDHPSMLEWARLILDLMPSAEQIRFVNSGTEGTMLARAWPALSPAGRSCSASRGTSAVGTTTLAKASPLPLMPRTPSASPRPRWIHRGDPGS